MDMPRRTVFLTLMGILWLPPRPLGDQDYQLAVSYRI